VKVLRKITKTLSPLGRSCGQDQSERRTEYEAGVLGTEQTSMVSAAVQINVMNSGNLPPSWLHLTDIDLKCRDVDVHVTTLSGFLPMQIHLHIVVKTPEVARNYKSVFGRGVAGV
jgi:hypothetical protein